MRINIKAVGEISVQKAEEFLLHIEEPAILLDENLKIIRKNIIANEYFAGIRRGTKFNRFISEKDIYAISAASAESVLNITLIIDGAEHSAMAVIVNGFVLLVMRRFYAKMLESVISAYGRMSGYDAEVSAASHASAALYRDGLTGILFELLDTMEFLHGLPFFNASSVLRCIAEETGKLPHKIASRFEFIIPSYELITIGADSAFATVVLFTAAFIAKGEGRVKIEISENGSEILLRVGGKTHGTPYDTVRIASIAGRIDTESESFSEQELWVYMAKLLSDSNLWDFEIENDGFGNTAFLIRSPHIEIGEEFALRDPFSEFIAKAVSELLGE